MLLAKDYVLLSLDTGKHTDAEPVIGKLRGDRSGGIPWFTILDGAGKELASADGPKGNVGCPAQPHEIAWFRKVLGETRKRLVDADLDTIQRHNEAFAERWLRTKKQ